MLEAGAARVCITPPLGIRMQGYAVRDHGAEGVHDDLYARVVVLRQGGVEAALVACDLCHMPVALADRMRALIAHRCGIPAEHVMINCSHTHSGPSFLGTGLEARYGQALVDHIVGAVGWARREMKAVRMRRGRLGVQLGINRRQITAEGRVVIGRNPDGPVIPHVDFALLTAGARPVAVLFSHACHPTTLTARNYDISADFPGAAQAVIEAELGCPALFLQGACADVNPEASGSFAEVALLGRRLAYTVLKGLTESAEEDPGPLRVREMTVPLPLETGRMTLPEARSEHERRSRTLAEIEARVREGAGAQLLLELWEAERQARWAKERYEALQTDEPLRLAFPAHALAVGDVCFIGFPAEIFASIGLEILAFSPYAQTVVLGYTNGYYGYFPDAAAWDLGGYEVDARVRWRGFPLARSAPGLLVSAVHDLLEQMHGEAAASSR